MSLNISQPHLLLISLISKAESAEHITEPSAALKPVKRLWEEEKGGLAVQLGVDWKLNLLMEDKIPARKVPLVHIDCSGLEGKDFCLNTQDGPLSLDTPPWIKKLSALPGLQLIILSNVEDNEVARMFLENKIPLQISLKSELNPAMVYLPFYRDIIAGKSLQQAFVDRIEKDKSPLTYQEISIDPIQKKLKWDEDKLGKEPDWRGGLTVRRLDKHRLTWKLQPSDALKRDSFGARPTTESPLDLSIYFPSNKRQSEKEAVQEAPKVEEDAPSLEAPQVEEERNTPGKTSEKKPSSSRLSIFGKKEEKEETHLPKDKPSDLPPEEDKKPRPLENTKAKTTFSASPPEKETSSKSEEEKKGEEKNHSLTSQKSEDEKLKFSKTEKDKEEKENSSLTKEKSSEIIQKKEKETQTSSHELSSGSKNAHERERIKNRNSKPDKEIKSEKNKPEEDLSLNTPPPVQKRPLIPTQKSLKEESQHTSAILTKDRPQSVPKPQKTETPRANPLLKKEEATTRRSPNRLKKEKISSVATPVKGPKHKKRVRRTFIGAIAGIIIAGMGTWFFLQNPSHQGIGASVTRCPFPSDEDEYRILVAPFNKEGNCNKSKEEYAEQVINAIQRIKKADELRVAVRYQPDICLQKDEDLKAIAENCHADLILGGAWRPGVSEGETHLQMFYVLAEDSEEEVLVKGKGIRTEIHGTETLPASSILLEDVKNFVYWAAAMRAMERGYNDDAVLALEKIEASRPELQSLTILMMTKSLVKGGRYQRALSFFDKLIEEEPQNEKYYQERAMIHLEMGWPQKALKDFEVVLSFTPENIQALINRSKALSAMERYQEALRDIESLLENFDQLPELYMTRASIYRNMERWREAKLDYEKAISLDPNSADAYVGRAEILAKLGDLEGAKDAIDQALTHDASHPEANLFSPRLLMEEGQIREAVDEINVILSRYPSAEAHFLRGQLYQRQGKEKEALKDFIAASEGDPSNTDAWITQGDINLNQGKTQQALNAYRRAIDLRSGDPRLFCLRGEVYTELKRYPEARADYEKALEIDPELGKAYYGRALLSLQQKEFEAALKDVEKAIQINSKDPRPLIVRGRINLERDENEEAFKDFGTAIKLAPQLPQAYYYRGISLMQQGEKDRAEKDFDKAVSLGGAQLDAYLYLGDAALESGEASLALERYNKAVDYDPESPEPYRHRAMYYHYQNDIEKALQDYDKLIELQGEATAEDYLNRGELHLKKNNNTQALVDYNQALLLSPNWTLAYCTRGDLYKRMGRSQKALEDYNKGIEATPASPLPYLRKAELFIQLEDEAQAFEAIEQAIKLAPQSAQAFNQRGELYIMMEMPEKAMADFQKSLDLDPTNADVYTNLGNESKKSGKFQAALAYYNQAIRFDPRQAEALYQRGFLKFLEKNYPSAIRDLQASIKADPQNGLASGTLAKIYAVQKQEDKMFYYLELALQNKYPSIELSAARVFKPYIGEEKMQDLIERYP